MDSHQRGLYGGFLSSRQARCWRRTNFRIFRFHFLLGADWKLCCRRLNIDRGTFFHAVYRIEQKLGRAYREIRPTLCFLPTSISEEPFGKRKF